MPDNRMKVPGIAAALAIAARIAALLFYTRLYTRPRAQKKSPSP